MNLLSKNLQNPHPAPAAAARVRTVLRPKRSVRTDFGAFFLVLFLSAAPAYAADFKLTSPAFKEGESIPREYTCQGNHTSPALQWSGAPAGTQSFALIVTDPDTAVGTWTHWVLYNLPPMVTNLPKGIPAIAGLANGERNGNNGLGQLGYYGPCPPSGNHRYYFTLYALDSAPALDAGASKDDLLKAMEGHVLGEAVLMGRYETSS